MADRGEGGKCVYHNRLEGDINEIKNDVKVLIERFDTWRGETPDKYISWTQYDRDQKQRGYYKPKKNGDSIIANPLLMEVIRVLLIVLLTLLGVEYIL